MLTRTAAAVKFDLPSTPEQKACSMHLGEGLKTFWSLVEHLQHAADEHQPIHQVEEIIFRELLVVGDGCSNVPGLAVLGTCPTLTVAVILPGPTRTSPPDQPPTSLPSIFGEIAIERISTATTRSKRPPWMPTRLRGGSIRTCSSSGWSVCVDDLMPSIRNWDDPGFGHDCQGSEDLTWSRRAMSRCFKTDLRLRTPEPKGRLGGDGRLQGGPWCGRRSRRSRKRRIRSSGSARSVVGSHRPCERDFEVSQCQCLRCNQLTRR